MSYIVLARRLRPKTLSEVVGQTLIVQALTNALNQNKLHPAYLLTGTHGTGKTTLGRIIAKAINCEDGPLPCLKCNSCQMIQDGTHPDLYEIDAASRTKVEDTRDVLEHVQYLPVIGKKKVYLIDEVHMLSQHSFNALLKTLEEPPAHIQFILATTEPHKIPKTILSRCLHFNLQPISHPDIVDYLASVLKEEKIKFEKDALSHIAQASKGSMRDALSLLDQLLAISPEHLNTDTTSALLSTLPTQELSDLLLAVSNQNIEEIQKRLSIYEDNNIDFRTLLTQLAELIVQTSIHKLQDKETPLTSLWTDSYLQVLYRMLIQGIQDLQYSPSPYLGSLMCLIRMAVFYPEDSRQPAIQKKTVTAKPASTSTPSTLDNLSLSDLIPKLNLTPMLKALLSHCNLSKNSDIWQFTVSPSYKHLLGSATTEKVSQALENTLGKKVRVSFSIEQAAIATPHQEKQQAKAIKTEQAKSDLDNDPVLKSLLSELSVSKEKVQVEPLE